MPWDFSGGRLFVFFKVGKARYTNINIHLFSKGYSLNHNM